MCLIIVLHGLNKYTWTIIIYNVYFFECSTPQGHSILTIFQNIYKLGIIFIRKIKKNIYNSLKTDIFEINE